MTRPDSPSASGYVFSVNFWGTTAKILEQDDGGVYFRADQLERSQAHFLSRLEALSRRFPDVSIESVGDLAFGESRDLEALVRLLTQLFCDILDDHGEFRLWPLRAAIAKGVSHREPLDPPRNMRSSRLLGAGLVEAAYLEKAGQKGMRLFLSTAAAADLEPAHLKRVRPSSARGLEHHEYCWLLSSGRTIGSDSIRSHFDRAAQHLSQIRSNYCQQLGAALDDLVAWSDEVGKT